MWQVLREQEGARVYSELQSKHRAAYGDDEAAREAAGKAALLRAKESLSTGLFAARHRSEQRRLVHTARVILQCYWARDLAFRKSVPSTQIVRFFK